MKNIVYLATSHIDGSCNYLKTRLATLGYLFTMYTSNVTLKLLDKTKNKKTKGLIIDLDGEYKDVAINTQEVFDKVPSLDIDLIKHKRMFGFMFGSTFRYPTVMIYALSYSTMLHLSLFSPEEILKKLNRTNVHKTKLGWYMKLIFKFKLHNANHKTISNEIVNAGGDGLSFYKCMCKKYKLEFDPITYIKNLTNLEMLLGIVGDPTFNEYHRDVVVHFQNTITLGKLHNSVVREKDMGYLLSSNALADRFIYSIYLNKYEKNKQTVLISYICNSKTKYKPQIEKIIKEAKKRYPGVKQYVSGTIIRKRP